MKRFGFFWMMAACIATAALSSCIDTSDETKEVGYTLTEAQQKQCSLAVMGNYEGQLLYLKTAAAEKPDTLKQQTWSIANDTVLTIHDFPLSTLAGYANSEKVKTALEEAEPIDIEAHLYYQQLTPSIGFYVAGQPSYLTLHIDDTTTRALLVFYISYAGYYSSGAYWAEARQMQMQLLVAGVYADGSSSSMLTGSPMLVWSQRYE